MKKLTLTVVVTVEEIEAVRLMSRVRGAKIVAGVMPAYPEDRAIAKFLLAADEANASNDAREANDVGA